MTAQETPRRRLIVRWTAPKGFAAILLFFLITVLLEVIMVMSFQAFGVVDKNAWTANLLIPSLNWAFTVSISPLFHLLPISVIVVLLSSWAYFTKHSAYVPRRTEPLKRVQTPTRKMQEKRRLKSLRSAFKRFSRRISRTGREFRTEAQKMRGVSYVSQRLSFARTAVRTAVMVFAMFICIFIVIVLAEYPDLIHQWTLNLYRSLPSLQHLVTGIGQWAYGVGQAISPLGGLGSAISRALVAVAPGFRRSLEGAGAAVAQPLANADVTTKYIVSQNIAAWISALITLTYGAYATSRPARRTKAR